MAPIVGGMLDMAEAGSGPLELMRALNREGPVPGGKLWRMTSGRDIAITRYTRAYLLGESTPGTLPTQVGSGEGFSQLGGDSLFADTQERSGLAVCARTQGPLQKEPWAFKFAFLALPRPLAYHHTVQRRIWAPERRYGRLRDKSKTTWDGSIYRRGILMDDQQVVRVSRHRAGQPMS